MTPPVSVTDAAYRTVHDYPGGAGSLAPRLGVSSARVLDNKVNPNQAHHKLTLDEAVDAMVLSGDVRILHAIASRVAHVAIPVCHFDGVSDEALLDVYTTLIAELGNFSATFHDALADGRITRDELGRLRADLRAFERAGEELLNRAEQLVDD